MVEGLRRRYGIIRTRKSGNKTKKVKREKQVDAFAAALGDLDI